jgi:hypothetical protein
MILYTVNNLRIFETRSDKPDKDWTGKADFVIDETNPENAELLAKIKQLAPCFDYVTDADGNLIDVVKNDVILPEPEPEPDPEPTPESEAVTWDELDAAYQKGVDSV